MKLKNRYKIVLYLSSILVIFIYISLLCLADNPCEGAKAFVNEIKNSFSKYLNNLPVSRREKVIQEGYFEVKSNKRGNDYSTDIEIYYILDNLPVFYKKMHLDYNEIIKTIKLSKRSGLFYNISFGAAGRLQCTYVLFGKNDSLEIIDVGGIASIEDLENDGIDEIIKSERPRDYDFLQCDAPMALIPYWNEIYNLDFERGKLINVSYKYPTFYASKLQYLKENYNNYWSNTKCKEEFKQLIKKVESFAIQLPIPPDIRNKFFGVQTHFGQHRPDIEGILDMIKQANIDWIRDEVYWAEIEKKKGVFEFPLWYDEYIRSAQARGIQVLLILDFGNPLYTREEKSGPATNEEIQAFAQYCKEVVKRYKPWGVRHYEIWNEPNISTFWLPWPNANNYLKLLEKAYKACKEADPDCVVLGCATSGMDADFIEKVFSSGGGRFMDAVSIHPYNSPQPPEQRLLDDLGRLKSIVGEKPIWITEIGYPTYAGENGVDEQKQANYLVRTLLLAKRFPKLQRLSWYDFQNDGIDATVSEFNFGLVYKDKKPKPAYNAYKTLVSLIRDFPLVNARRRGTIFIYTFEKGNDWVIAVWKNGEEESIVIPVSGSLLRIIERDGESKSVNSRTFLELTVSEKPRYIVPSNYK